MTAKSRYPERKEALLAAILAYKAQTGLAPTIRSLAVATGWSPTTLQRYVRELVAEGSVSGHFAVPERTIRIVLAVQPPEHHRQPKQAQHGQQRE